MHLEGKVAIVTGAGMGIGRAVAEVLGRARAAVVVADLNVEAGGETVAVLRSSGCQASFVRTDVSRIEDTHHMVDAAIGRFERLDILVNSAGVYERGDVVTTPLETWERLLSVNLTGVFLCCKAAIPAMRQTGGGAIVNLSSSVGWQYAAPGIAAYAASKFGVTGLTKAMACDHLSDGVRVNCICPGPTDTPLIRSSRTPAEVETFVKAQPIGRLGLPGEIAAAVLFLTSDEASFITGVAFPVDGGQSAFP